MAREGLMDDCGYNFDVDEDSYNSGFKDGFLTAVDEFAEKLKDFIAKQVEDAEYYDDCFCDIYQSEVDEIAEQLKEE
jgi:hypothetical protein